MDDAALTELKREGGKLGGTIRMATATSGERNAAGELMRLELTRQFEAAVDRLFPELVNDHKAHSIKVGYLRSAYYSEIRIEELRRDRAAARPPKVKKPKGERINRVADELFA